VADLFDTARDTHDRYYTPRYVAESFTRWLRVPPAAAVLEPSVGGGAWVRALREGGHHGPTTAVDIDPQAAGLAVANFAMPGDFARLDLGPESSTPGPWDLCIGNPPFGVAGQHLAVALRRARVVAWLLRSTFIEPTTAITGGRFPRRDLLRDHPPWAVWLWPERIRFGGAKGSDSVLHALHIWVPGHTGDSWTTTMCRPDLAGWMPPAVPWRTS